MLVCHLSRALCFTGHEHLLVLKRDHLKIKRFRLIAAARFSFSHFKWRKLEIRPCKKGKTNWKVHGYRTKYKCMQPVFMTVYYTYREHSRSLGKSETDLLFYYKPMSVLLSSVRAQCFALLLTFVVQWCVRRRTGAVAFCRIVRVGGSALLSW